jgi:hypothetical protein
VRREGEGGEGGEEGGERGDEEEEGGGDKIRKESFVLFILITFICRHYQEQVKVHSLYFVEQILEMAEHFTSVKNPLGV